MRTLSIHVDESGDFGPYSSKYAPHYIFSLVFHEQSNDLTEHIKSMDKEMANLGFFNHVVHTGPLIRKEDAYCNLLPEERRMIFTKLFFFAKNAPISYKTFLISKKEYPDENSLKNRIEHLLSAFVDEHSEYFQSFGQVILYYDNGQQQLSSVMISAFESHISSFYRKTDVHPYKYKLLQVTDMLCTLKLLEIKADNNSLSHSEKLVFKSGRDLKKEFIKKIRVKEIK